MRLIRQIFSQQNPYRELHACIMEPSAKDPHECVSLFADNWRIRSQADVDALYHLLCGMLAGCREDEPEPVAHPSYGGIALLNDTEPAGGPHEGNAS